MDRSREVQLSFDNHAWAVNNDKWSVRCSLYNIFALCCHVAVSSCIQTGSPSAAFRILSFIDLDA
jgi:hypothetical protein